MVAQITFRQLRYFIATAECGKIQVAAEKEHISASAVAGAIRSLEETLGVALFKRHRNGVDLTYDGHRFLDKAQSISQMLSDSVFELRNETINVKGKLVIGASVSVLGYFLAAPLSQFERIYPNVEVCLVEGTRVELERKLTVGEIDIAFIISSNISITEGVEVRTLFHSERTVWCAEGHRFSSMTKVPLKEIEKEKFIMLTLDEAQENIARIWQLYGHQPEIWLETLSVEAVRSFIAREQGVTILSKLLYRPWSLDGTRILSKSIEESVPTMDLGIVWPISNENKPQMYAFVEFLIREFRDKVLPSDIRTVQQIP